MSLELEDPALQAFCASLIADSLVGQFVRTVLGGSAQKVIKLPTASQAALTPLVRTTAMNVAAGDGEDETLQIALVEQLCGLDASDFGIMGQHIRGLEQPAMSIGDFAGELASRLHPYFEGMDAQVSPFPENAGDDFHLLSIGHTWRTLTDQDWGMVYEMLAGNPVSSLTIMRNAGGLLIWISGRKLTASLAWIVALDVLRNYADDIGNGELWQSDSA